MSFVDVSLFEREPSCTYRGEECSVRDIGRLDAALGGIQ